MNFIRYNKYKILFCKNLIKNSLLYYCIIKLLKSKEAYAMKINSRVFVKPSVKNCFKGEIPTAKPMYFSINEDVHLILLVENSNEYPDGSSSMCDTFRIIDSVVDFTKDNHEFLFTRFIPVDYFTKMLTNIFENFKLKHDQLWYSAALCIYDTNRQKLYYYNSSLNGDLAIAVSDKFSKKFNLLDPEFFNRESSEPTHQVSTGFMTLSCDISNYRIFILNREFLMKFNLENISDGDLPIKILSSARLRIPNIISPLECLSYVYMEAEYAENNIETENSDKSVNNYEDIYNAFNNTYEKSEDDCDEDDYDEYDYNEEEDEDSEDEGDY